jgi:hypothetical protein
MSTRLTPAATGPALLVGLLALLGGATVALPPAPAAAGTLTGYVGTVTVNGQPAAAGSALAARIGDLVVGDCTVTRAGTYQLELHEAALAASQAGATISFTLNDRAVQETALLQPGTMQPLALSVSQPTPAAAAVTAVATAAAQRIVSAPAASTPAAAATPAATPAATLAPTPAVAAAVAPAAVVQPQRVTATPVVAATTTTPVVQVAGAGTGPTAQPAARLPATSAPAPPAPAAVLSTTTVPRTTVAAVNAPVASAPARQRATGTTPTQLPSTGVGLGADTQLSRAVVLPTWLLTTMLLSILALTGRQLWRIHR